MFNQGSAAVQDDKRKANRRVTLTLDDELVREAQELVGTQSMGEYIRQGLVALMRKRRL